MLSLVLHALRARRAQSLAMFALAALAGLGASAAPWFLGWGNDAVARVNVASATVHDRLVLETASPRYEPEAGSPIAALHQRLTDLIQVPGAQAEVGARTYVSLTAGPPRALASPATSSGVNMYLGYRDDVCAHVHLADGACPADGETMLSRRAAGELGVGVGDQVAITGIQLPKEYGLRVSGVYDVIDSYEAYWTGTKWLPGIEDSDDVSANPALVTEQTLLSLEPDVVDLDGHVLLPPDTFVGTGASLRSTLAAADKQLRDDGFVMRSGAVGLLDRIDNDRMLVLLGVGVGVGQLVLVCWVGLFLAVRHTSEERRADIGLLKLRGAAGRRVWALVGLSSGVPMFAGTVVGAVLGFAAATALTVGHASIGAVARTTSTNAQTSLWLSLAAAAVAGLGGLVAAVVAEWRTVRTAVVDLLRRVPGGRRGWRADIADLVVVVLAVAGVYQAHVEVTDGSDASVFALLAPALVGLAAALLVARALPPVAARVGAAALRAGRAGLSLAALQLARRHGTQRILAVLAVAAAVFTTTTVLWHGASSAWQQRALQELGADRVLTVGARNPAALLTAVRAVDPDGRYAMAVASTTGARPDSRVVAVDSTRLARVGRMAAGLPSAAELATLLRPAAPAPATVTNGPLTVDVIAPDGIDNDEASLRLALSLSTVDGGQAEDVTTPPLVPGRQSVSVAVTDCPSGCRLTALQVQASGKLRDRGPVTLVLQGVHQPNGTVLDGQILGDIARWRTTFATAVRPPLVEAADGQLTVTISDAPSGVDTNVMPLTAPVPMPVVLAGRPPTGHGGGDPRVSMLGGTGAPFRVVATVPALPVVASSGELVDLEYALRNNDASTGSVSLQVWLTKDAPDSLVAALADHGVTVLGDQTVTGRANDLAGFGPGLALRFAYFGGVVVLLLAAGVAVVGSTVDRDTRVAELTALRGQGLSARAVRVASYAGSAALAGIATVTGIIAALLGQALVSAGLPVFSDDWDLLPAPPGLTPLTLLLAVAVVVVVLGIASLAGAGRLVAAVQRGLPAARDSRGVRS